MIVVQQFSGVSVVLFFTTNIFIVSLKLYKESVQYFVF